MGGKALKKNVEKLLANILNDTRKITADGKTLGFILKKINEGNNVETVKTAICEGTGFEASMTNNLCKDIVKYFNDNKER
jgi:hypothetical protein